MKILSANDKWHNVWILIDPGIVPFTILITKTVFQSSQHLWAGSSLMRLCRTHSPASIIPTVVAGSISKVTKEFAILLQSSRSARAGPEFVVFTSFMSPVSIIPTRKGWVWLDACFKCPCGVSIIPSNIGRVMELVLLSLR